MAMNLEGLAGNTFSPQRLTIFRRSCQINISCQKLFGDSDGGMKEVMNHVKNHASWTFGTTGCVWPVKVSRRG